MNPCVSHLPSGDCAEIIIWYQMVMSNASKKMPLERQILASIAMEAKNSPNFAPSRAATPPLAVKTLDRAKFGEKTHQCERRPGRNPC